MAGWLKVSSVQHIAVYLLARGIPPAELLRRNGLPGSILLDREAWMARGPTLRLVCEMSRQAGDPWAGLHIAELQDLRHFGAWGSAVRAAPTLGAALRTAAADIQLIHKGTVISLATRGHRFDLRAEFIGCLDGDPTYHYQDIAFVVAKIVRLASEPVAIRVALPGSAPRIADIEPERLLQAELDFQAPLPMLSFDRAALVLPLRRDEGLEPLPASDLVLKVACDVFDEVKRTIAWQRPCIVDVAVSLGIPLRTLQRHLECWGLTFEQIVDEYRQLHAVSELTRSGDSITDIAFRFGYSDSSHFTRAVRRWTGQSPRQVRLEASLPVPWRAALAGEPERHESMSHAS